MYLFIYRFFISLYRFIIRLISPFNAKARLWQLGRKNLFERMQASLEQGSPYIWMHCASLGEYEQGRPVLEQIKENYPAYRVVLTFFSPSGYEVVKIKSAADHVFYIPLDTAANAKRFFDLCNPSLVIFIKYEFWYFHLREAKKRNIPLLLVSGIFRPGQPFFEWYGKLHRQMLGCFTHLLVQNESSLQLLAGIGFTNASISGDTRFDRVADVADQFVPIPLIESFTQNWEVLVAGSTWTEDDKELAHFCNSHPFIRFIIAPHNINDLRISECKRLYRKSVLFSQYDPATTPEDVHILIIDNVGMLSRLYKYATVCYVGGAFGHDGVHNVLEPAVYGKPVVYGPEYHAYAEAIDLVEQGGAFACATALELEDKLKQLFTKGEEYNNACHTSFHFVQQNKGATGRVMEFIQEKRLLTN